MARTRLSIYDAEVIVLYNADNGASSTISRTTNGLDVNGTLYVAALNLNTGAVTNGTWQGTAVGPTYGGTNQTSWATGDLLYASGVNTLSKLTIGGAGTFLISSGGIPAWSNTIAGDLVITGNLTINGTVTTTSTSTLAVDDITITMAKNATLDTQADGGGIILKGATDKSILWDNANDNWTANQSFNLSTGLVYKINNVSVLSATVLGSSVVTSSLTTVGVLNSGSITSGFGSINIGTSTITSGAITSSGSGNFTSLLISSTTAIDGSRNFTGTKVTAQVGNIVGVLVGADTAGTTLTNATRKAGIIASPHYTNAEQPAAMIYADSPSNRNELHIGGGHTAVNASTEINFYTAANTTTTTGSLRMYIASDGDVFIGSSSTTGDGSLYLGNIYVGTTQVLNSSRNLVNIGTITSGSITSSGDVAVNGGDITSSTNLNITPTGNLTLNPSGDIILNPTGNDILPTTNYDLNLGSASLKFLTLHAAELVVETLVAQDTMATIGGRVLVAPTTVLTADLTAVATTISVKHNNLADGDRIYLEAGGNVEFMAVTSVASGVGPYTYTVTRNLDGTGANTWVAGDAVFNTGTTGDGFIDIYANRGVRSGTEVGPTIVGNIRNSATYNDWSSAWAIGNLNGLYGYGVDTYGAGFGKYIDTSSFLLADATNGIRIRKRASSVDTTIAQWDINGNITLGDSSIENLYLTSTSVQFRNGATVLAELNASVWTIGITTAEHVLINTSGVDLRDNTTSYGLFASTSRIGDSANEHVLISATGVEIKDGATVRATYASTITLGVTSTGEYLTIADNAITMYGNATAQVTITNTPTILIGASAGSGANVYVTATTVALRDGTTDKITLDGSTGNISLVGSLVMGTSGVFRAVSTGALTNDSGWWLDYAAGTPILRIGTANGTILTNGIYWSGSGLEIKSANFNLAASASSSIGLGATAYGTGNGVWLSNAASTKFRVGNAGASRMQWDDADLQIYNSANALVASFGATNLIGSWSVTNTQLSSTNTFLRVTSTLWSDQSSRKTNVRTDTFTAATIWSWTGNEGVLNTDYGIVAGKGRIYRATAGTAYMQSSAIATGISSATSFSISFEFNTEAPYESYTVYLNIYSDVSYSVLIKSIQIPKTSIGTITTSFTTDAANLYIRASAVADPIGTVSEGFLELDNLIIDRWVPFVELSETGFFAFNNPAQYIKIGTREFEFKGTELTVDSMTVLGNLVVNGVISFTDADAAGTTNSYFVIDSDWSSGDVELRMGSNSKYMRFNTSNKFAFSHALTAPSYNGLVITADTGVVTTGTWNATAIITTYGGTGLTSYTAGDTIYWASGTTFTKLAIGSAGKISRSSGTAPTWSTLTLVDTAATGSILHASSTNTITALAIGTAGKILRSTGTLPAWTTSTFADTYSQGTILYAGTANTITGLAIGTSTYMLQSNGTIPVWVSTAPTRGEYIAPVGGIAQEVAVTVDNYGVTAAQAPKLIVFVNGVLMRQDTGTQGTTKDRDYWCATATTIKFNFDIAEGGIVSWILLV